MDFNEWSEVEKAYVSYVSELDKMREEKTFIGKWKIDLMKKGARDFKNKLYERYTRGDYGTYYF